MRYRSLGRSGLRVSELSLGTMTFGGSGSPFFEAVGGVGADVGREMVAMALDVGVNLFDTADVYSRGLSEEILGESLRGRRASVLVATKCHGRMSDGVNDLGQSRHHIVESCERSLRRLRTDYIDLYQIHGYDAHTNWEESLGALEDLRRAGKIRYTGCSNLAAWQLMKALSVSDRRLISRFSCLQANYSLAAREAELELMPLCEEESLGFVAWSPLAGGFLTDKYSTGKGHGRRDTLGDPGTIEKATGDRILCELRQVGATISRPVPEVALAYLLAKPGVTSVLVGARDLSQLEQNLRAIEFSLDADSVARLDAASDRPLPYPHWHQRQYNASRARR